MPLPDSIKDFQQDLPWLANNSLPDSESSPIAAAVADSDTLHKELLFLSALRTSTKQIQPADLPLDFAWRRFQQQILTRKQQQRLSYWRFAALAASFLLVVQSLILFNQPSRIEQFKPLASATAATFQIRFTQEATQGQIQKLLRKHHLRIIDGPGASGLYAVAAETDDAEVLSQLQQSDVVDYVQKN